MKYSDNKKKSKLSNLPRGFTLEKVNLINKKDKKIKR
jgi:hypothetical protein